MGFHKDLGTGEQHIPYNWEYADATARTAATGFVATDEGKLARQLDDDSLWMLTDSTGPTWVAAGGGASGADFNSVVYPTANKIGSPIHIDTLQEVLDHALSSGVMHGCDATSNGDGTMGITAGYALVRATADSHSTIYAVEVGAQSSLALTDNATNYVYLDYNAGSPVFVASTSSTSFNCLDKCIAFLVHREGNDLTIIDVTEQNVDPNRKSRLLFKKFSRFIPAEGGSILASPSSTHLSLTAGSFFYMLEELPHSSFNTATGDTFSLYYRDGVGGFVKVASKTTIDTTLYDDGTGTPALLDNNKYGVSFVYLVHGNGLAVVRGRAQYASIAEANAAATPSTVPAIIGGMGSLVGLVTYQKGAATFSSVLSSLLTPLSGGTGAEFHNSLAGIQGGAADDYYHLTGAQASELIGGGDSTLHYHAADRDRANHTGTQLLETIAQSGAVDGQVATWNGTNGAWEPQTPSGGTSSSLPTGTYLALAYEADPAPSGYFPCDGTVYNKVTYADLYAVIGTKYGAGGDHTNGKPWKNQYAFNMNTNDFSSWAATDVIPSAIAFVATVVTGNRIYTLGGEGAGGRTNAIYSAGLTAGGDIDATGWVSDGTLPAAIRGVQPVLTTSRLYLFGGLVSGVSVNSVYSCPLKADKTLDTANWTVETAMPTARHLHRVVVTDTKVVIIAGYDDTSTPLDSVISYPISSNGVIDTTTATTEPVLPDAIYSHCATQIGSRIYVIGGYDGTTVMNTVYYAEIDTDGTLLTWQTDTALPDGTRNGQIIDTGNKVWLLGGQDGTNSNTDRIMEASTSGGTIGAWSVSTDTLPVACSLNAVAITSGYAYLFAGYISGYSDAVYQSAFTGGYNSYDEQVAALTDFSVPNRPVDLDTQVGNDPSAETHWYIKY